MARSRFSSDWMLHLPMVLLGLRSDIREDGLMSSAELVYGSALRLPGELLPDPSPSSAVPQSDFLLDLQASLRGALPLPVLHHGNQRPHRPSLLDSAQFVYVRVDAVRPPLVRPYEGPYRVVAMDSKTCRLLKNGRPWIVSVDRLKPAVTPSQLSVPGRGSVVLSASAPPFRPAPSPPVPGPRSPDLDDVASEVGLEFPVLPAPRPAPPVLDGDRVAPGVQVADVPPAQDAPRVPDYATVTRSGRVSKPPERYGFP